MKGKKDDNFQVGDWVHYIKKENLQLIREVVEVNELALILLLPDGNRYEGSKKLYRKATKEKIKRKKIKDIFIKNNTNEL